MMPMYVHGQRLDLQHLRAASGLHAADGRFCAHGITHDCGPSDAPRLPRRKDLYGSPETTTDLTIEASITGALLGGGNGYQSFRYQHLVNNPRRGARRWPVHCPPGCNWPEPTFAASALKLTATLDASQSQDVDQGSSSLQVRYDFDGDAVFDTPWLANAAQTHLCRYPGTWRSTVQCKDSTGHVSTTRRRFQAGSAVTLTPGYVNAIAGGAAQIQLDVGPAGAGDLYLVPARRCRARRRVLSGSPASRCRSTRTS